MSFFCVRPALLIYYIVRMYHSAVKNRAAKTVVLDTPADDADIVSGTVLSSQKKRPVPYVVQLFGRRSFHCLSLQTPN